MRRKQCRICRKPDNDDLISVQLVQEQLTIADMIFAIAGVSVTSERRLPQNICLVCLEHLKVAYRFRQQCIESDTCLRAELLPLDAEYLIEKTDGGGIVVLDNLEEDNTPSSDGIVEILEISEERFRDVVCAREITEEETNSMEQTVREEQYAENTRFDMWQENVHYLSVDAECFTCCGCHLTFSLEHELKVHSIRFHRKSKYRSKFHPLQCTVCYQTFHSRKILETHQAKAQRTTQTIFQCVSCSALIQEKRSLFYHLEEHTKSEIFHELNSAMCAGPSTAVERLKIEIQSDNVSENDHASKYSSIESLASCDENWDEEYAIEINYDGESAVEEDDIDINTEAEHMDEKKETSPTGMSEHKNSTSKGQRNCMENIMCRIPQTALRVVTKEECYSIVELIEQRCCCCTEFFKTSEKLEKHLAKKRETIPTNQSTRRELDSVNTPLKYICEYCGQQFKYSLLYVTHKRIREQRQFYMCRLCKRLFASESRMKSHMLHTEEHAVFFKLLREDITDRYESVTLPGERCCCCWKYFENRKEVLDHLNEAHALETRERDDDKCDVPYACGICKRSFTREQYLERHLKQVTNVLQHFCKLCDFQTRSQRRIELHLYSAIHRGEMPSVALKPLKFQAKLGRLRFCCFDNCTQHFRVVQTLYEHVRESHQSELKTNKEHAQNMVGLIEGEYVECDVCGQLFNNVTALVNHQSQLIQQVCVCSICGIKKRSRAVLLVHERSHTGERPYGCDFCDKTFSSTTTLNSHLKCHTPRKYECSTCKEMFARLENLKRHILLRHSEAAFQCEVCPKKFKTRETMAAHKRTHTGEKPYKCRTASCDKRYVNIGDRRRHEMAVHTLERPHKCSYCNSAFIRKRQLVIHERRHTGDKPFACTVCEKGFYEKAHLNKHSCNGKP